MERVGKEEVKKERSSEEGKVVVNMYAFRMMGVFGRSYESDKKPSLIHECRNGKQVTRGQIR